MRLSAAMCFAFVLAGAAPLAAQSPTGNTPAEQATGNTAPAAAASDPAEPKPQKKKKSASAQKRKTGAAKAAKAANVESGEHREHPRSGAAVVKEGGKTCSGLDQYRVCW